MSEQKVVYRCEDIDRLREQLKIGDPVRTEVWFDRLGGEADDPPEEDQKDHWDLPSSGGAGVLAGRAGADGHLRGDAGKRRGD